MSALSSSACSNASAVSQRPGPKGDHQNKRAVNSDGSHLAASMESDCDPKTNNVTFLFCDGGQGNVTRDVVADKLAALEQAEVKEFAEEFGASVILGVNLDRPLCDQIVSEMGLQHHFQAGEETSWHVLFDASQWALREGICVEHVMQRCDGTHLAAAVVELQRRADLTESLGVILIKVLRGTAGSHRFITMDTRKQIMNWATSKLSSASVPTAVVGDFGIGMAGLLQYLFEQTVMYNGERSCEQPNANISVQSTQRQDLQLLFTPGKHTKPDVSSKILEAGQSRRMLVWQIAGLQQSPEYKKANIGQSSGGAHPIASKVVGLKPRVGRFLELLEAAACDDDRVVAEVLFHPIQNIHIDEMGVKTCRPVTVDESLLALSSGLEIIRSARNTCASPPPADGQQLSSVEFDMALGHTKQIFVAQFLDDAQLKADYEAHKDGRNTLTRSYKKVINGEVRSRHRTWMTKLIGNWDFFKVTLRYGYFDAANKKNLVKAILQERATSQTSGGKHPTGSAELRKVALHARQEYKRATKLRDTAREDPLLTKDELKLLGLLADGTLNRRRLDANHAYGHGEGAQGITKEQLIVIKAFTDNVLDAYFREAPLPLLESQCDHILRLDLPVRRECVASKCDGDCA